MRRKLLWILIAAVILATFSTIFAWRQQCMSQCTAGFQGAYPEIACKYECSFLNKFKKPLKRP